MNTQTQSPNRWAILLAGIIVIVAALFVTSNKHPAPSAPAPSVGSMVATSQLDRLSPEKIATRAAIRFTREMDHFLPAVASGFEKSQHPPLVLAPLVQLKDNERNVMASFDGGPAETYPNLSGAIERAEQFNVHLMQRYQQRVLLGLQSESSGTSPVELAQHNIMPVSYAFDDSFMQHFGQAGVDAVNRAMRNGVIDPDQLLRELTRELKLP